MPSSKNKVNLIALFLNSAAIALALFVLTMDCSVFLFWLALGVFDGHWNDISLQVLFVCVILSFLFFLFVAALFGLGNRFSSDRGPGTIMMLTEFGALIDSGWERALRASTTCAMVALSLLVACCLSFWRDFLWWSDVGRGMRAQQEGRFQQACDQHERSDEIATTDRKPFSEILVAGDYYDLKKYNAAERYFVKAIEGITQLRGDNRGVLVSAYLGLARTLMHEGKLTEAEATLRAAAKEFGDPPMPLPVMHIRMLGAITVPTPTPPPTLMGTLTLLEGVCIQQGRLAEARKVFEHNLDQLNRIKNLNPRAIIELTGLYVDLLEDAQISDAKDIDVSYKYAEDILRKKNGDDSEAVGVLKAAYAQRLFKLKRVSEAEQAYDQALTILKKTSREGDFVLLKVMNSLAGIYASTDRIDEAEKMYKTELETAAHWSKPMGNDQDVQIQIDTCRADYAALLRQLGRGAEADKLDPPRKSGR